MDQSAAKQSAGETAAQWVKSGMQIGLGTGSTTAYAIRAIGRRVREEGLNVRGVPTSSAAELLAREHGVPLCTLDELTGLLDLALDGADEVSASLDLIKGRGAAHTQEKLVARQARRFVVLIDPSKQVDQLGSKMPVPIEVIPMAASVTLRSLDAMGAKGELRLGLRKDGPVVTDQGFWVIDAKFDGIEDPASLDSALLALPGVLDHGLFVQMATDVIIGTPAGVQVVNR